MFDHIHQGPREVYVKSTSTEHRAPTDESVKLLREMEESAKNNLIGKGRLQDNLLNFHWWVGYNGLSDSIEIDCLFSLNGKEMKFRQETPVFDLPREPEQLKAFFIKVRDQIITIIAEQMTYELVKKDLKYFRNPRFDNTKIPK